MRAMTIPALLALSLAACSLGEDAVEAGADVPAGEVAAVWRSRDDLEGCTAVLGRVFEGRPGRAGRAVDLHLRVDVRDSAPGAADTVRVMVHAAHSGDEGTPEDAPPLRLTLDGGAVLAYAGDTGHSLLNRGPEGGVVDRVDYLVPLADLRRIAAARGVEGDAGIARFTLTPAEIAVVDRFATTLARTEVKALPEGAWVGPDCESILGGR